MTAEIAVMNRSAVALAADSAVTIEAANGRKIYNTVNKLFCLTKCHPVGIMIYGNADVNGVPWETLIKTYRQKLGDRCFPDIGSYGKDFFRFLNKEAKGVIGPGESKYVQRIAYGYLELIKSLLQEEMERRSDKSKNFSAAETLPILSEILADKLKEHRGLKRAPAFRGVTVSDILRGNRKQLLAIIGDFFGSYPITKRHKSDLLQIIGLHFIKGLFDQTALSGIVIAGFGDAAHFPCYCHYLVEGYIKGRLRYYVDEADEQIAPENGATIRAFAQTDMAHAFMEGIDPSLLRVMSRLINGRNKTLPDEIIKALEKAGISIKKKTRKAISKITAQEFKGFESDFSTYRNYSHVSPVMATTAILPKDELAAMAEALVSLASFKKRVSMTPETVGGPIDVAVISKGDGFIWIKRKHYFKAELNPDFFRRNFSTEEIT